MLFIFSERSKKLLLTPKDMILKTYSLAYARKEMLVFVTKVDFAMFALTGRQIKFCTGLRITN